MTTYPTDGLASAKSTRPCMMLNNSARTINALSFQNDFIGHILCPDLLVPERFGVYPQIDETEYWKSTGPSRFERGASAPQSEMTFTERNFQIHRKAQQTRFDNAEVYWYSGWYNIPAFLRDRIDFQISYSIEQERCNYCFADANIGTANNAATVWTTSATCTPIDDVQKMSDDIFAKAGVRPNTMVISRAAMKMLQKSEQMQDACKGQGSGNPAIAPNMQAPWMASVFELESVIIADVPNYDTGTGLYQNLYGSSKVLLFYRNEGADIMDPRQWCRRLYANFEQGVVHPAKSAGTNALAHAYYETWDDPETLETKLRAIWWDEYITVNKNCAGTIKITA